MSKFAAIPASCSNCGANFRVPRLGRSYTCKSCGGTVTATQGQESGADAGEACSQCQAITPAGSRFCEECGAPLADPTDRGLPTAATREARAGVTRELRRARKALAVLQLGFRAGGVIALLLAVLLATWWYRLGTHGWDGTILPRLMMIWTLVWTVEGALLLTGAACIRRAPFVLALVLASLSTVFTASLLMWIDFDAPVTIWSAIPIVHALYSLGLWLLVPSTLKLQRLREEHPELFASSRKPHEPRGDPTS